MTLGRKGLTSAPFKGLTVCCVLFYVMFCVCFTTETCCEKYTASCFCWQEKNLYCLHTGLSPVSFAR
ncbi:unnamed protein product [Staurois parvus]|uniref:Uncharacterized protein n=1 Tax=Staurois parvus TaxID=386267 RepID=A0ABN9AFE5_9NEOB|nr:unnamed protein product [Staurois parvus]